MYLLEREQELERAQREREKQTPNRVGSWCEAWSRDPGVMTWAKGRHLTNWATQVPQEQHLNGTRQVSGKERSTCWGKGIECLPHEKGRYRKGGKKNNSVYLEPCVCEEGTSSETFRVCRNQGRALHWGRAHQATLQHDGYEHGQAGPSSSHPDFREQWFSTSSSFVPQGTFGNSWGHF